MSYRVDKADDINQLLEMMRSDHARESQQISHPTQVEQQDNVQPGGRQIAHPTKVDANRQMDSNISHGGRSIDEQVAMKADPNKVFSTSETAQHSSGNPTRGQQQMGVQVGGGGRTQQGQAPVADDPFAGLDPFEIHGANGAFVGEVVNPENDRLAQAHKGFHQRLSENKVVANNRDVEKTFFDATDEAEMQAEFFPEEVVSGPTGVWDTSGLEGEKQVTATMVQNPLDERVKKS
jgi:hypothetical protein